MEILLGVNTILFASFGVIWTRSSNLNSFFKILFLGAALANGIALGHILGYVVKV